MTATGSPGPAHARGELRTVSAGFPATKVVGCGETEPGARQLRGVRPGYRLLGDGGPPTNQGVLASSTVMGES
jgi:hypothetical protein